MFRHDSQQRKEVKMAEFNDIQAHKLADMCLSNAGFSAGMVHLMQDLKGKDISLGAFNKKIRKMRRDTTGVTSGVALSTGVLTDQICYSTLSTHAFGEFVLVSHVEDHQNGDYGVAAAVPHKPQVGDYFEYTGTHNIFGKGTIVQLEDVDRGLFKVILGTCEYNNARGNKPGAYYNYMKKFKYLPMYIESNFVEPPVITATQIRQSVEIDITIKQPKEIIMQPSNIIATQINVFGANASALTDEQLFDQITRVEAEIDKLGKCKNKPKKLEAKIEEMKSQLVELVKYIDSRD